MGVKKSLANICQNIVLKPETCTIEVKDRSRIIHFIFSYLSPKLTPSFEDEFTVRDTSNEMVIMGDLNARVGSFSPELFFITRNTKDNAVNGRGRSLISYLKTTDLVILNGCSKSDRNGEMTFVNRNGSSCIDLCLVSRSLFYSADFKVLDYNGSSHFPIMLSLNVCHTSNEHRAVNKVIWNSNKTEDFQDALYNHLTYHPDSSISMCHLSNYIQQSLCDTKMIVTKMLGPEISLNGPPWFDNKCLQYKIAKNKALRNFRKHNKDSVEYGIVKSLYLDKTRAYMSLLKAKKTKFFANVQTKLSNSKQASDFYKALNIYRPKYLNSSNEEHVTAECFADYFSKQFNLYGKTECSIESFSEDLVLDRDFTLNELDLVINKLSRGKSPGCDNIPNEAWKALTHEHRNILLETLNNCWNTCNFPVEWSKIVICPIFKKGDPKEPSNYRPISLLNTGLKLFTMLMSNRLNQWCEERKCVSDYQAAYRKNYGCDDHIFVLNSALQANTSKKRKVFALFIDLSKAFDSVRHDKLWSKLVAIGISSKFLKNIQCIYANAKAQIRTKYGISNNFPLLNSVFQGETLSPKLFTLFIEDIVGTLNRSGITSIKIGEAEINILLYADDMIVLAYNVFDLQAKINVLIRYFSDNDLQINIAKTKIVIFRQGNGKLNKPKVFWGSHEIEIVDKYVYLGVPMYGNMKFKQTVTDFINKGRTAEKSLFDLFRRANINTLDTRLMLFESLVKSVLLYCSHVWGLKGIDDFRGFYVSYLRKLLRMPRYTPHWFLMLESQCKKIEISFLKSLLTFWAKILTRDRNSLIFKCYEHLRLTTKREKMKLNWYRDFYNTLQAYDCIKLIDVYGHLDLNQFNCHEYKRTLCQCLEELQGRMIESDIIRMQKSSKMPYFKIIKTHCKTEEFMNSTSAWYLKALFVQLRANIPRVTIRNETFNLNALGKYFDNNFDINSSFCTNCSFNVPETLSHVIFFCPSYVHQRNTLLNPIITPTSQTDEQFVTFCSNLDIETLRRIFFFLDEAMKIRAEWINSFS